MRGDSVAAARAALGRFREFCSSREAVRSEVESRSKRAEALASEMESAMRENLLTSKAAEVVKRLLDVMSQGGVKELEAMLSYGVDAIFSGRGFSVEIEVDDRGKDKVARLWLAEAKEGADPVKTLLYDGNGGGLAAVASLMLRAFLIVRFGRRRFIAADEPMSDLSKEYTGGFLSFLRLLVDELGFVVLMNTHDERFLPEADRVYRASSGKYRLLDGEEGPGA